MVNTALYLDKLKNDLLQQFKDKPNIAAFQKALARQLNELFEFFDELNTLRWLKTAEGVQLDGIGDIVAMSRMDALFLAGIAGKNVPMDDETYRVYLTFKIHLNTSDCTHSDIYYALRMFWNQSKWIYTEQVEHPATMLFSTETPENENEIDDSIFNLLLKVKAAGVTLKFFFNTDKDYNNRTFFGSALGEYTMITINPVEPVHGIKRTYYYGAAAWEYAEITLPPKNDRS